MGKRLLSILTILTVLSLTACSSDKDDEIILSGTTWENSNDNGKATLSFQKTTFALEGSYDYNKDGEFETIIQSEGTYEIENTAIRLIANGYIINCRIDGNAIYFKSENTNTIIFYRK